MIHQWQERLRLLCCLAWIDEEEDGQGEHLKEVTVAVEDSRDRSVAQEDSGFDSEIFELDLHCRGSNVCPAHETTHHLQIFYN